MRMTVTALLTVVDMIITLHLCSPVLSIKAAMTSAMSSQSGHLILSTQQYEVYFSSDLFGLGPS